MQEPRCDQVFSHLNTSIQGYGLHPPTPIKSDAESSTSISDANESTVGRCRDGMRPPPLVSHFQTAFVVRSQA